MKKKIILCVAVLLAKIINGSYCNFPQQPQQVYFFPVVAPQYCLQQNGCNLAPVSFPQQTYSFQSRTNNEPLVLILYSEHLRLLEENKRLQAQANFLQSKLAQQEKTKLDEECKKLW